MKREAGYYFVQHEESNVWDLAFWSERDLCWYIVGVEKGFQDSDFLFVDERKINLSREDI